MQLRYQTPDARLLNLAYRYNLGTSVDDRYEDTDLTFRLPLGRRVEVVGRWLYSLLYEETMDAFAGIEFGQCCWRVRLLARNYKNSPDNSSNTSVMLQVELAGLGAFGQSIDKFLESGIYGYQTELSGHAAPSAALFGLVALALWGAAGPAAGAEELNAIVAVVNDDVIVNSELQREINKVLPELKSRGTPIPSAKVLNKQVLERLISQSLQSQRAAQLGIKVDDAMLTQTMTGIASRNGLTLDELRATLENGGMRFEDFREDTRSQMIDAQLQKQEVLNTIAVTEPEIDRFLAKESGRLVERSEVRLQHILIAFPENASPEQMQKAQAKAAGLVRQLRCRGRLRQARHRQLRRAAGPGGRRPGLVQGCRGPDPGSGARPHPGQGRGQRPAAQPGRLPHHQGLGPQGERRATWSARPTPATSCCAPTRSCPTTTPRPAWPSCDCASSAATTSRPWRAPTPPTPARRSRAATSAGSAPATRSPTSSRP